MLARPGAESAANRPWRHTARLQTSLLNHADVELERAELLEEAREERDGLVQRRAYATVPRRVEYSLTPLGHTLTGPLWAVKEWAEVHVQEIETARAAWDARTAAIKERESR